MRVGMVGTGAIAAKHALAYRTIGFSVVACTNRTSSTGEKFAAQQGCDFVATIEELCSRPGCRLRRCLYAARLPASSCGTLRAQR